MKLCLLSFVLVLDGVVSRTTGSDTTAEQDRRTTIVASTRLARHSHRDLQVVTVGTGTCTERLGCDVGTAAVCWLEERTTQNPLYVSGCLRLVEDLDNGRVQIGDRGVLGNPNRTLLACGACDCHDAIIAVAFPASVPPPSPPRTRRLSGGAVVGGVDTQALILEDMSCPSPIPKDGGGCEACPYGVEYRFSTMETSWEAHMALAMLKGCHLASIKSKEEQEAAVLAMQSFIGFPYQATENFQSSFAYIGAKVVYSASDPAAGRYTFEWVDGSGQFEVFRQNASQQPSNVMSPPYSNFITSDPNGGTAGYEIEPYLALSLNEHGSVGITRGDWIDFSARNSPALYKCCAPPPGDFSTCFVKAPPTLSFEY